MLGDVYFTAQDWDKLIKEEAFLSELEKAKVISISSLFYLLA